MSSEETEEKLLRALAEIENMRKRKAKEVEQARDQGEAYVAHAFLEVIDDFERAFNAMKNTKGRMGKKQILGGLQLVFDKFGKVLEKLELEGFDAEGKKFQAELMEAIAETPTRALPPGTVAGQVRKGYKRRGNLLRPAQVAVAVEPKEDAS